MDRTTLDIPQAGNETWAIALLPIELSWELDAGSLVRSLAGSDVLEGGCEFRGASAEQGIDRARLDVCISANERAGNDGGGDDAGPTASAWLTVSRNGVELRRMLVADSPVMLRTTGVGSAWSGERLLHADALALGEGRDELGPWLRSTMLVRPRLAAELLLARTTLLTGVLRLPGGVYQAPTLRTCRQAEASAAVMQR